MGDFNTVFEAHEVRSRSFNDQERRIANQVKQLIDSLALEDSWTHDRTTHTWRQAGTKKSSRLDRILYQHNLLKKTCSVDWAFTNSDHSGLEMTKKFGKGKTIDSDKTTTNLKKLETHGTKQQRITKPRSRQNEIHNSKNTKPEIAPASTSPMMSLPFKIN